MANKPSTTKSTEEDKKEQDRPSPTIVPRPVADRYKDLSVIRPEGEWPPPIYIDPNASPEEIYYMENRWFAQWLFYDQRAVVAKRVHQRLQLTITVGSAAVPVLVGIQAIDDRVNFALYLVTIIISFLVAGASAIETVKKYGDAWRSYRTATEELMREKSLYDVKSGPYRKSTNPFLLFVERCEDVMAKQNGVFLSPREEQTNVEQTLEQAGFAPNTPSQSADVATAPLS